MADTAVAITAGTGTNIDTRTEGTNSNHRQVIVIGDPATNAGVAPVDATTGLAVNVTNSSLTVGSHAVTNAGTFATQATLAAETTKVIGTVNIASAQTLGTVTTVGAVTSITNALPAGTNAIGKLAANSGVNIGTVTIDSAQLPPSSDFVSGAITTAMTSTTSTSLLAAPGAALHNYITTLIVSNAHATVGTDVIIQDGASGTTLLTIPAAAVYGGAAITFPTPLRQPTANTALYCANVTTGASTKVSVVGYKAA